MNNAKFHIKDPIIQSFIGDCKRMSNGESYDTVTMTCHSCGDEIATRTYAGAGCNLRYNIANMPWMIQQVFDQMAITCKVCSAEHLIKTHPSVSVTLIKKGTTDE